MSQFYSNSYEKFLYEKYEEYKNKCKKLSEENDNLKITIERERQLYKLQLEQTATKVALN